MVYSMDPVLRMAHDLKKDGLKIGLKHGTFDLFHVFHLDPILI